MVFKLGTRHVTPKKIPASLYLFIDEKRQAGDSIESIRKWLYSTHDITVSNTALIRTLNKIQTEKANLIGQKVASKLTKNLTNDIDKLDAFIKNLTEKSFLLFETAQLPLALKMMDLASTIIVLKKKAFGDGLGKEKKVDKEKAKTALAAKLSAIKSQLHISDEEIDGDYLSDEDEDDEASEELEG